MNSSILRLLAIGVFVSMLVVAAPARPALAAYSEDIYLDPSDGEIGDSITVEGDGFEESTYISLYFTDYEADAGDSIDDEVSDYEVVKSSKAVNSDGEFEVTFTVPDELTDGDEDVDVDDGDYYVCVTYYGDDEIVAVEEFTVDGDGGNGDESISASPTKGKTGVSVTIEGDGFEESTDDETVYISLYFTPDEADEGDSIDDEVEDYEVVKSSKAVDDDGEFEVTFKVPQKLTDGDDNVTVGSGTYYICATYYGDEEIVAVDDFTVIGGEIKISPNQGIVGTEVEITGTDFANGEDLKVKFDSSSIDIDSGDETTDSSGEFSLTIIVPVTTAGSHTITVSGDNGYEVKSTFTVKPEVTASPLEAPPGDPITISGTGFGNRKPVDITLCNVYFEGAGVTDSNGSFSISLEVPDVDDGIYSIAVRDESGNAPAAIQFTVEENTAFTVSPLTSPSQQGYVGMNVTVSGVAFEPNSPVTITYASTPQTVATTTSDASGAFTASFPIPKSIAGEHTITASDGTNSLQVPFYVESKAPSTPPPLLPLMGGKAAALTYFDWEDVGDDSLPVTYTLQVATSQDFASASLVLVKEGLTSSEYTVTEEEKLASRSSKEPYYWRVKAVDGASNSSPWTGAGEFYVGFSLPKWTVNLFGFTLSVWTILWWGIGMLVVGLVAYSLGKRRG